jgi:hypothetical protein
MDIPNFTGLTIWGLFAVIVGVIGQVALKFFAVASVRVKLVVFFSLYIFLGILVVIVVKDQELTGAPKPSVSSQQGSRRFSFIKNALAQSNEGWIYCGDYDSSSAWWSSSALNVARETPRTVRGKTLSLTSSGQLYDRPPTFSVVNLKWDLGAVIGSVSEGQSVTIKDTQTLGRNRVWCRIIPR